MLSLALFIARQVSAHPEPGRPVRTLAPEQPDPSTERVRTARATRAD